MKFTITKTKDDAGQTILNFYGKVAEQEFENAISERITEQVKSATQMAVGELLEPIIKDRFKKIVLDRDEG